MPDNPEVVHYREQLVHIDYSDYALDHADTGQRNPNRPILDLSLWHDEMPAGVQEAIMRSLPRAVGAYALAQDPGLIAPLAERLETQSDNIIITAGADDALRAMAQYCIRRGTRVLIPQPSFGRYEHHAKVQEASLAYLPFSSYPFELDTEQIVQAVQDKHIECLFIANPNSPTGHALDPEAIARLLDAVSCTIILDESLLLPGMAASSVALVESHPELFVCGSFSKRYGIPGLRVGYLIANSKHTPVLTKLLSPFGVAAVGLEAAKYMVLQDEWLAGRIEQVKESIAVLHTIDGPKFRTTSTCTSVALVEYTGSNGSLHQMLLDHGVSTVAAEKFPGLGGVNAVRVIIKSVSDIQQLERILVTLP